MGFLQTLFNRFIVFDKPNKILSSGLYIAVCPFN